jgi:predicted RNA binding protein YcfA (HicA-like mRNA interferase family)
MTQGTCSASQPKAAGVPRKVVRVPRFPSLKAKKLIRVLEAQPLGYRIVRQKGSHRRLEAPNHPPITFAFHDNQTIRPGTVKDILCNQVGLAERDSLALL